MQETNLVYDLLFLSFTQRFFPSNTSYMLYVGLYIASNEYNLDVGFTFLNRQIGMSHLIFQQSESTITYCIVLLILDIYMETKAPYQNKYKTIRSIQQPSELVETP